MTPLELQSYKDELAHYQSEVERLNGLIVNLKMIIELKKAENEKTDIDNSLGV